MGCGSAKQLHPKAGVHSPEDATKNIHSDSRHSLTPTKPYDTDSMINPLSASEEKDQHTSEEEGQQTTGYNIKSPPPKNSIEAEFPEDPFEGRTFEISEEATEVELPKGVTYRGDWLNAQKHGIGEMKYADGGHYIGEFRAGRVHGSGIFTAKDGSQYRGSFKEGKACGYAVYTFKDGTKYYGPYVDDRREGFGREVQSDDFRRGNKHGKGVLRAPNNETYVGDFANGEIEGSGVYTWPDGRVYSGGWERSKQNGYAEFKWNDGRVYKGHYKDGKINGDGVLEWPDGRKYDGQWKDGFQNGIGKYWAVRGQYREAQFLNGVRVRWLGDFVNVADQEAETELISTKVDVAENQQGIDSMLKVRGIISAGPGLFTPSVYGIPRPVTQCATCDRTVTVYIIK